MQGLLNLLLRLALLAAGLVFAAALLLAALLLVAVWGLRYLWARISGRPVTPFVMRMDPRSGFSRVYRGRGGAPGEGAPGFGTGVPRQTQDPRNQGGEVVDVESREVRD